MRETNVNLLRIAVTMHRMGNEQKTFISHSPEDWEVQYKAPKSGDDLIEPSRRRR